MHHCSAGRLRVRAVATLFLIVVLGATGHAKSIRLRNEVIQTPSRARRATIASNVAADTATNGLFLIQFHSALNSADRAELRQAGVDLLTYVPDDTFVARLNGVSPTSVARLSSVRWIGPYQPQHKIHPDLAVPVKKTVSKDQTVDVSILLAPSASTDELAAIRSLLSSIQHESPLRQGTIIRGKLLSSKVAALAASSAVLWIEPAPQRKLVDEAAAKIVGGDDGQIKTPTLTEQLGFDGSGVTICVADTGLDSGDTNTMHPDLKGRVVGFQAYGSVTDGSDGYGHGTHCAGIVAGNAATGETDPDTGQLYGLGVASGASLFIERIFDDVANEVSPFPSDATLTQDAVRHGAKIGSNSWGNPVNGAYDIDSAQFDELVRDADAGTPGEQPYILEFSAGNEGPGTQTLDSPASAKNVLSTGASENQVGTLSATYGLYADGPDSMCDFSSRGPAADGRIKPDVVAPGSWIASAASSAALDEEAIAWSAIDNYYVYMGGTSMSGPHAAGAAAVFVQFYKATHTNAVPSPALVKAALINSADELDQANGGPGPVPNNDEGWGRINLANIIVTNTATAPRFYQYVDQTVLLTNSQFYSQHVFVEGSDQPLKVTLTYTDVPGFPGALPALVNDLDLEVVAPNGTLYRGNQFGAGESVANTSSSDKLNNVEGVVVSHPVPGDYLVRVRASKIVQDSLTNTAAIDQDFALVASGNFTRPGTGIILLDRPSYTAPGTMQIEVLDAARAGNAFVNTLVTNNTSHTGTTKLLAASGNYGVFTGMVATVTGVATGGQLHVGNSDSLEVDYNDVSATKRIATAIGDLSAATISGVTATIDVGVLTISWQTSEPATSVVHYGTNSSNLNLVATDSTLVTNHVMKLTGLIPGKTYFYLVNSTDAASNTATNNNSGAFYSFVGVATPTVLLVDDYDTPGEANSGSTVIPDSSYTNVLAATGFKFGFWKVTDRGSPQLADLKPFPVVIWRTTDDAVNYGVDEDGLPIPSATHNTLSASQQLVLQNYLNGGGSFFMSSMGILTQLGDVPFRRNVLQVGDFAQNPDPPTPCADCDEDFGVPAINGAAASVANGINVTLDYSNYPSFDDGLGDFFGPDFSDTFTPASSAATITFETASGKPCGMSYPSLNNDSPGRVVFLSFPFDTIPTNAPAPNNAIALLKNIINFLAPGANGIGTVLLDNSVYTTNDVVTVQVGDSDLAGTGQTSIDFTTTSSTNHARITLFETTHPGLFKGTLTLVASGIATNKLAVHQGDIITATYADLSGGSNVTATATIDTIPPVISQVAAVTDYSNAKISWFTSKPADSSVQYSESPLPDRSAYLPSLTTNHSVTISGLAANRKYFYEVISRDQAGNTTLDDNHGSLYSFQTLKAPTPPWFDNLETSGSSWTVVPDTGSEVNWLLGTPNNSLSTAAYSGTNAWGCSLHGEQPSLLSSSYLVSPVIDLSGVTSATLSFWDMCDFSQVEFGLPLEDGVVFISTNSSVAPSSSLPLGMDFVGNSAYSWQQETVNLSGFVGKSIQLVFYYQGVAIDNPLVGWLIDDISITGNATGGTVNITKNLGQGAYNLFALKPAGATLVQSGTALSLSVSNLAAGQYAVEFGDVPYYQTPADQTNTLSAGGTIQFTGTYSFADVNHNGISDAWETDLFGSVSPGRTQSTDTDKDGMTDYAEFIAGTNPTNAASRFYFTSEASTSNHLIKIDWSAVSNRLYQVSGSASLTNWTPLTAWLQSSNTGTMSYFTTNSAGLPYFYRVQVQP